MRVDPVEQHLSGTEGGDAVVTISRKMKVPMRFDLLRLSPQQARMEQAFRVAAEALAEKDNPDD